MGKHPYYTADYFTEQQLMSACEDREEFDPDKMEYNTVSSSSKNEAVLQAKEKNYHKGECYNVTYHFWNYQPGFWDSEVCEV
jgi:hypothetical protein